MAISNVGVTINGTRHVLTYNSGTGLWEATITAPGATSFNLDGGFYDCSADATNAAGTQTAVGTSDPTVGDGLKLVVKETIKPVAVITSPSNGAHLASNQPPIVFTLRDESGGSGVKISTLKLTLNGVDYGSSSGGMEITSADGGYDVIFSPPALTDGDYTVAVTVEDNDGNLSVGASASFTINTVPPELNVTSPADGFVTNNPTINLEGMTNSSNQSSVTLTVKHNENAPVTLPVGVDGSFSTVLTAVEGANTIIVTATDLAGQVTTQTITGVLDTTAPEFRSVTITPNPVDAGATLTISVEVVG